jgi:Flp pilus assembly pilin Flp
VISREERGQASIEFILVVGAILVMVVAGIPIIQKNAEMNRGLTAARDGATKGAAMRGLGYAGDGVTPQPSGAIKILNITPEYQGPSGDLEHYKLI